jgi:hypothetical protein
MVGATAIDLTAFVRSRILNLFVRFVRFVVKHPVSGPHAIGPITEKIDVQSGLLYYGTHAKNCQSFRRRHVVSRPQSRQSVERPPFARHSVAVILSTRYKVLIFNELRHFFRIDLLPGSFAADQRMYHPS